MEATSKVDSINPSVKGNRGRHIEIGAPVNGIVGFLEACPDTPGQ